MSDGELRRMFRIYLPQVHWTTVESRFTESGIPDIEGCDHGRAFWVECKKTRGWTVRIRPAQIAWILRRIRVGGRVTIAVRAQGKARDELLIVRGAAVRQLRDDPLTALPPRAVLGRWKGGPKH